MSPPGADARTLIPAAVDRFGARVHAVPSGAWDAPTPCDAWTVRDLVNHLCSEHRWAPLILAGRTMDEVGDRFDGDLVGDDPVSAWDRAAEPSRAAWRATGSHAPRVHVSFGWLDVEEYAVQMLVDLTVHEWDLARGAGLDEELDAAGVEAALAYIRTDPIMLTGPGLFARAVRPRSPSPRDELLALVGRRV
ncbi:TIGR03086 family metal-binding protein [Actinomycetospora endophytica]|uniref:TIGR03086 family metal-binding protein n=1 Tax=Actinomycetospora endophytica TaxID=2291215 RepID=A0ABS8PAV2_9PSEU|nr:TIGR03086 family metal-binding protein [Actinomycetospora endophytica]MCD2195400.1 TIGR03086 family metal-binding protein [Actinomycetospora endophytica]